MTIKVFITTLLFLLPASSFATVDQDFQNPTPADVQGTVEDTKDSQDAFDLDRAQSIISISRISNSSIFAIGGAENEKRAELINDNKIYFKKLNGTITGSALYRRNWFGDNEILIKNASGKIDLKITEKSALRKSTYITIEQLGTNRRAVSIGQKVFKNRINFIHTGSEHPTDSLAAILYTPGRKTGIKSKETLRLYLLETPCFDAKALMALSIFKYYRKSDPTWVTGLKVGVPLALLAAIGYYVKTHPQTAPNFSEVMRAIESLESNKFVERLEIPSQADLPSSSFDAQPDLLNLSPASFELPVEPGVVDQNNGSNAYGYDENEFNRQLLERMQFNFGL